MNQKPYGSIKFKLLRWGLVIAILISFFFGLGLYQTASTLFYRDFLKNKKALTQTIAAGIDGDIHRDLIEDTELETPEYKHYSRFLQSIVKDENDIAYLYTVHFNTDNQQFYYVVDAEQAEEDLIWFESSLISGYAYFNEDNLVAVIDETTYSEDFTLTRDEKEWHFRLSPRELSLEGQNLFTVQSHEPLEVITAGTLIDLEDNYEYVEQEYTINNVDVHFGISLTGKGDPISYPGDLYMDNEVIIENMKKAIANDEPYIETRTYLSSFGEILSAYGIIHNKEGDPTGLVMLDINNHQIKAFNRKMGIIAFFLTIVALGIIGFFSLLLARNIILPLDQFIAKVGIVSSGNLEEKIQINRKDEFGHLADQFNLMVSNIKISRDRLTRTTQSYARFVPMEFLKILRKDDINQVQRGDVEEQEVAILFSDIREFTTISEKMSPKENFNFLNDFLGIAGPKVRDNNGFIDKYIGDAIMALFTKSPQDAVNAAIDIFHSLVQFNQNRAEQGKESIHIGIGLHSGRVMLGIIGEENRIEGTAISDTVNLASRIEGLTKQYRTPLLISEDFLNKLENPDQYCIRPIGRIKIKGKSKPIAIDEIILPFLGETEKKKEQTRMLFSEGVEYFSKGELIKAKELFNQILESNPKDLAAKIYLEKIGLYHLENNNPETWEGVIEADQK